MLILIGSILIGLVSIALLFGVYYRRNSGVCTCSNKLNGKTVIITGATEGIGKEAALDLASRGARVILACRNLEKAEKTRVWIVSLTSNKNIVSRHLELSDLDSVRKFAEETLKIETRLDVLINNAGIITWNKQQSKQGYELTLATNHYGSFLLTSLLLGLLKESAPSRIINVTSSVHESFHLDLDDIHFKKKRKYDGWGAYCQSKLCNVLFTKELSHRLVAKGIDVTVNSVHPGAVATNILTKETSFMARFIHYIMRPAFKDSKLGAQTLIHLAISDKVKMITGEYFVDCRAKHTSRKARDPGLAKQLWELSEEEVGLTSEERHI